MYTSHIHADSMVRAMYYRFVTLLGVFVGDREDFDPLELAATTVPGHDKQ